MCVIEVGPEQGTYLVGRKEDVFRPQKTGAEDVGKSMVFLFEKEDRGRREAWGEVSNRSS